MAKGRSTDVCHLPSALCLRILPKWLGLIILTIAVVSTVRGSQASVPPDHPVYDFLQRMESKGLIRDLSLYSGPHSRTELAELLYDAVRHADRDDLSGLDQWYLTKYLAEFSDPRTGPLSTDKYRELHLVRYDYRNWTILGDFHASIHDRLATGRSPDWQFNLGGEIRANYYSDDAGNLLGGYLRMLTRGEPAPPNPEDNFDPEEGIPVIHRGGIANTNHVNTGLLWRSDLGRFSLAHDRRWWGRGEIDGLQLGASAPPGTYFRYTTDLEHLRFSFLTGGLRTGFGHRFFAGHRLEWQPFPWLQLAVSETVVYGDSTGTRGIEAIYLNPLIPYIAAEPAAGNRDNNTSSLEATIYPYRGIQAYFQWFLDDLTLTESLTRYYGNKWGLLVGCYISDPVGVKNSGLLLEYVRLEPWVYTHQNPVNRYQHFGQSLGYPMPPNSDRWLVEVRKGLIPKLRLTADMQYTRHGDGDFEFSHQHPLSRQYVPEKQFLQGDVTESWIVAVEGEYEYLQLSYCRLRYEYRQDMTGDPYSLVQIGFSVDY